MRLLLFATLSLSAGLLTLSSRALADDGTAAASSSDDDDDLFKDSGASSTKKKGENSDVPDAKSFKDDDDGGMPTFTSPPPAKPAQPDTEKDLSAFANPAASIKSTTKMPLDTVGKDVLGDNWGPSVVIADKDAVVVEMPVLYARSRAEFDGVAYWLVAEVSADGKKVAEQRIYVTRDAIADKGPSIQFFRMFAPVPGASGMLEITVGKAPSAAAKSVPLFKRTVTYKL
jgi:hypothetical protein